MKSMSLIHLIFIFLYVMFFIKDGHGSSKYSPRISVYPTSITIKKDHTLFVTCLDGDSINEFEKVIWVLNGDDIETEKNTHKYMVRNTGNHSLIVWNVYKFDSGTYNCKIINANGIHYSPDIIVDVLNPPHPKISYEVSEPWVIGEKKNVTLRCKIDNNDHLYNNVRWYADRTLHTHSNNCTDIDIFHNSSVIDSICPPAAEFRLDILENEKWYRWVNPGTPYSCQALNAFGWGYRSLSVFFQYSTAPGGAKISCDLNPIIRGQKLTCECNTKERDRGYPRSMYRWYRNGEFLESSNSSEHTSIILSPENHLNYTCESHNIMGTGKSASITIDVQDKPDFYLHIEPEGPIYEGDNITMRCRSHNEESSPCPDKIYWTLDRSGLIRYYSDPCDGAIKPDPSRISKNAKTYAICGDTEKGSAVLHFLWVNRMMMGKEFSFKAKDVCNRTVYTEKVKFVINYTPGRPFITYSPEEVNRGDTVSLFCNASHDMGNPVATSYRWYYRAIEIVNVTTPKIAFQSGNLDNPALISCRAVNSIGNGPLTNVFIQISDSSEDTSNLPVNVSINNVRTNELTKTVSVYPSSVSSEMSGTVYLSCRYGDEPISEFEEIDWLQDGVELDLEDNKYLTVGRHESHSLYITNFENVDCGTWNCKITNLDGVHISPDIDVSMLKNPTVELTIERPEPWMMGGRSHFILHCKATSGNPKYLTKVKWSVAFKDIAETIDCDDEAITDGVADPTCVPGSQQSLYVFSDDNMTFSEFGDYRCKGFNSFEWSHSWSEPNYFNMIRPSPAVMTTHPVTVFNGRQVVIHCNLRDQESTRYLGFRWYKNGEIIANKSSIYVIESMSSIHEADYSCEAVNLIGGVGDRGFFTLKIIDGPDFYMSLEPQGIIREGDNVTFRCLSHSDSKYESPANPTWDCDYVYPSIINLKHLKGCKHLKPLKHYEIPPRYIEKENQYCVDQHPPALHLINVDRWFARNFTCSLFRNGETLESDSTELVINYKPGRPTLMYNPAIVYRGDILNLSCDGSKNMGVPKSTSYRWYKQSTEYDVRAANISIKTDTLESPVFFSCRLVNMEGFGDFDHVIIDILDPVVETIETETVSNN